MTLMMPWRIFPPRVCAPMAASVTSLAAVSAVLVTAFRAGSVIFLMSSTRFLIFFRTPDDCAWAGMAERPIKAAQSRTAVLLTDGRVLDIGQAGIFQGFNGEERESQEDPQEFPEPFEDGDGEADGLREPQDGEGQHHGSFLAARVPGDEEESPVQEERYGARDHDRRPALLQAEEVEPQPDEEDLLHQHKRAQQDRARD